jgi:molecular chaperone GrpE
MLPILDDFERATKALENTTDVAAVKEGMKLIQTKLIKTLESKGLKPIEAIGKDFNVEQCEAITEIQAAPEMAGKVIDEVEKGYYLNDKIIRFAKVVVGK